MRLRMLLPVAVALLAAPAGATTLLTFSGDADFNANAAFTREFGANVRWGLDADHSTGSITESVGLVNAIAIRARVDVLDGFQVAACSRTSPSTSECSATS